MRSTTSAMTAEPMKVPTKTKRPTTTIFQPCDLSASMSLPTARERVDVLADREARIGEYRRAEADEADFRDVGGEYLRAGESWDRDYAAERDYVGDGGEPFPRDEVRDRDAADNYSKQHEQSGDGLDEGRGGGSARITLSADPVSDKYLKSANYEEYCHLTVIHYSLLPSSAPALTGTLGGSVTPILRTSQLASGILIKTHI